jgi:hypothetical protein
MRDYKHDSQPFTEAVDTICRADAQHVDLLLLQVTVVCCDAADMLRGREVGHEGINLLAMDVFDAGQ